MNQDIDNTQDILNGRDVIERFEELESEREDLVDAISEAQAERDRIQREYEEVVEATIQGDRDGKLRDALEDADDSLSEKRTELWRWDEDCAEELKALADFIDEGSDEWRHGETLIRDSYFEDYARELAEEIGATDEKAAHGWPLNCIDWEQAARELQMDYSGADFNGVTYWYRS